MNRKNVKKSDLVQILVDKNEMTKKQASNVVDTLFDSIQTALKDGKKVQLLGFGNFEVRERAARKGRNPQTGEEIDIAASRIPAFKPGKGLKRTVNG
jgi:DNA-binding protein HU-beta